MMQIAESGFQEWHDPEEDIYTVEDGKPVSYEG
jgi:hypothetical protein